MDDSIDLHGVEYVADENAFYITVVSHGGNIRAKYFNLDYHLVLIISRNLGISPSL